ncbi:MAG: hypothetical protein HYS25_01360 [Ignavibacteriales bacterium]|nr:hypothetical protein [Ignavibacteriales bacterium]
MKKFFILFVLFISLNNLSFAQNGNDLETTLSNLSSTVGEAYVAPVISAFGSNLNSGWVSRFPGSTILGFHFDLKVIAMGSFFSDDVKRFSATNGFYFSEDQVETILQESGYSQSHPAYASLKQELLEEEFNVEFSGPTIIGSDKEYLKIKFPGKTIQSGNQQYTVDPYELELQEVKGFLNNLKVFPTAAAQLTVGTVAGTNVAIRYLPSIEIEDLGKFSFWGLGAIHNPGVWFPNPLPLDLGVGYFYQKLEVGDIFESSATQFGLYASKTFGFVVSITPYAGVTFESSKTTVTYDYQSNEVINGVPVKPVKIKFELEGENTSGFVVGFNLKLAAVNINADYKIAKTKTASAGISLGF